MRLSASELSIGYRSQLVGSGIDLALTAGELLARLGQNCAGKITLFRTLPGRAGIAAGRSYVAASI